MELMYPAHERTLRIRVIMMVCVCMYVCMLASVENVLFNQYSLNERASILLMFY